MIDINQFRADNIFKSYSPDITEEISGYLQIVLHSPLSLPLLSVTFLILVIGIITRQIYIIRRNLREASVLLELTPPATTEKTAYTTQKFFEVIHELGRRRSLLDKLLNKKIVFSLEIVSTQNQGIRYLIRTTSDKVNNIKRDIVAYLPYVQVKIINEYIPSGIEKSDKYQTKVIEFKQTRHWAYPLEKQNTLDEHDPVAYITGQMTKLNPGELVSFQLVLSPTKSTEVKRILWMILHNDNVLDYLDKVKLPYVLVIPVFFIKCIGKVCSVFLWGIKTFINDLSQPARPNYSSYIPIQQVNTKPLRTITDSEREILNTIGQKAKQPLFETSIRLLIAVKDENDLEERKQGFISSFAPYSVSSYQLISAKRNILMSLLKDKILFLNFRKRLLSFFYNRGSMLLSTSEISDLYHFPYAQVTQTENIVKVHSKKLPAPLSLKNNSNLDIIFARNNHVGIETSIGLTEEERVRHMYVIGATGTGKSTLLLSMINQDLQKGKGVCVVDPHGDLAEAAINCIPDDRINDFIYFNPFDIKYPIGLNLLELTPSLEEDDALVEKEFIAESVISLFRKVFSDAWSAHPHRIEYILRNTIHTAFTLENPTLFTIFDLLNNPVFQKKAIQGLQDENLKNFWKYEFGRAGDYQKVKMVAPVTARIGRFLFSPSARRILEQEKSTINFDEILDGKKILICNLAKGNLGEDTSEVMGIMILNKIQLAALKRARKEKTKRSNFYLYVDEFQNFATPSFVQMLSEARKYRLNLTMAEQSTSQQKDKTLVDIILANTGTVITFRSANPKDEQLLLPQFNPYVAEGEIANLPAFNFYMKKAAMTPEEPFSGETIPITVTKDSKKWQRLIQASRDNNATIYTSKQKTHKVVENGQEVKTEFTSESSGMPA